MTDAGKIEELKSSTEEERRLQALSLISSGGKEYDPRSLYWALGDESWRIRKEAAELFLAVPQAADLAGEIIELLYSEDNAGLRNTAVEILIALARKAVPLLVEEVSSRDHDVRKFVCDILGEIGDPASCAVLVEALGDPDENVRSAAAENLGKIGCPEAIAPLLAALKDPDLSFRFVVLDALGRIGTEVPIDPLLPLNEEKVLRKALFDCLGHIGAVKALPLLLEGLADPLRNVREAAALAIDRIGVHHPEEVKKILTQATGGAAPLALSTLLESIHPEVRKAAVKLLGECADGRFATRLLSLTLTPETREIAVQALVNLGRSVPQSLASLWHDSDPGARACLAFVFGRSSCPGVDGLLFEGLESADAELRSASAHSLGAIGGTGAIAPLVRRLDDPAFEVRDSAQIALCALGARHPQETFSALRPFLHAEAPEQRRLAVLALSELDSEEVDQAIALAMKDEASIVRQAAIRSLDGRAARRHLPSLTLALTDEDSEVRQQAVCLLGEIDDPQALEALQSALHDEDLWVRTCAVRSLGKFGGKGAMELVAEALCDSVGLVTIAALEILAQFDPGDTQGHLEQALRHSDEEVVNAALKLLVQAGHRDWIPSVCSDLINHRHWDVRITFARALSELVGASCRTILEGRLQVEDDDLVRQHLRELLDGLRASGG